MQLANFFFSPLNWWRIMANTHACFSYDTFSKNYFFLGHGRCQAASYRLFDNEGKLLSNNEWIFEFASWTVTECVCNLLCFRILLCYSVPQGLKVQCVCNLLCFRILLCYSVPQGLKVHHLSIWTICHSATTITVLDFKLEADLWIIASARELGGLCCD
jgi:hypothetical protein